MEREKNTFVEIDNKLIRDKFHNHFSKFVTVRTDDIWRETHKHSPELKELTEKQNTIYEKLSATLSKEESKLLEEYEEGVAKFEGFIGQISYELGFVDGIKIATEKDEDIVKMYPILK